jgi:hypothetical protein
MAKTNSTTPFILYKGYYYLHTEIDGRVYLGRPDTKLGWIVKSIKPEIFKEKTKPKPLEEFNHGGHYFFPATKKEIEEFGKLKVKKLKEFVELTKDQNI